MSWIKEEVLFQFLLWLSPLISFLVVTMEWVEAALQINDPLLAYYREVQKGFCLKGSNNIYVLLDL